MSGRVVVIKVGGTTLEDRRSGPGLWRAIAALHAGRAPDGGVVLVHGGGKAVDRHLDRLGFTTERREGIRITPPEQVEEIAAVLAGRINKSLVGALARAGARGVGLCLGDGGAVPTRAARRYTFDPGRVGEVVDGRAETGNLLRHLLAGGFLPVLCSIGLDEAGEYLNVNADDAAAGVAAMLGAEALVLCTDVPGILDERGQVVPEVDGAGIDALIAGGVVTGGMVPKVRAARDAARRVGAPVVILSGNDPGALEAWASGGRVGTRVLAS
ncbi:MAG: acetylglutamate kinase [Planctomycetota bacterium]|nr:acetylglutamate kinase [Planctomycetota bacterium]